MCSPPEVDRHKVQRLTVPTCLNIVCASVLMFFFLMPGRSSTVEDCDEAFVKNPDGRPLVLYLRTEEGHHLSAATRQLLEKVNAADKAAKIKVATVASCKLSKLRQKFMFLLT